MLSGQKPLDHTNFRGTGVVKWSLLRDRSRGRKTLFSKVGFYWVATWSFYCLHLAALPEELLRDFQVVSWKLSTPNCLGNPKPYAAMESRNPKLSRKPATLEFPGP